MPARFRVLAAALALVGGTVLATGCHQVDLAKNVTVTPVLSGYYDAGLLDGWAHLLPSLTFKLKATGSESVSAGLRVTVSFWFAGDADGENDSVLLRGLETTLKPGDETAAITARARSKGRQFRVGHGAGKREDAAAHPHPEHQPRGRHEAGDDDGYVEDAPADDVGDDDAGGVVRTEPPFERRRWRPGRFRRRRTHG
jgi:hypothetical protein